ncbi:FitA-like ribbon-helix-helix domain-containing protein [Staphylococcus pseudintermedius]|uniref:FitA-like ribbon-helix-helix domain-containing protein n=2 Tax=Staphylococcus pseudintermedius TaxID=283734 RepID=UPI00036CFC65|nr:hypothetical protein [Staphylococcus pseudintermedius]ANS90074.1 hypothetical protein A6M57_8790 [Staphylococcus pseudintermedius]EGQ0372855.1 hypothetical protein [Staphylococcus pseudintermedius]EGQ0384988.1 hypothetical protein [Staphylococcus pseudintermedius]EGQ0392234.1 hypothetical protein [Staphylococcus pseudintermedius]EGQ1279077.1 hypothetical protein [Staphylococcus pseudintermedius]
MRMDIRNIPEDTYNNLKVLAQMAGCSLNQLANDILEDYVSTQKMNQVKNDLADRIDLIEKSMQEIQVNQISLNFKLATLIDLFDLVYGIDEIDERNEFNVEEGKKL